MSLYEAYLIMKELLLSALTVKTEAYCFMGWFFLFGWFMYTFGNAQNSVFLTAKYGKGTSV